MTENPDKNTGSDKSRGVHREGEELVARRDGKNRLGGKLGTFNIHNEKPIEIMILSVADPRNNPMEG